MLCFYFVQTEPGEKDGSTSESSLESSSGYGSQTIIPVDDAAAVAATAVAAAAMAAHGEGTIKFAWQLFVVPWHGTVVLTEYCLLCATNWSYAAVQSILILRCLLFEAFSAIVANSTYEIIWVEH